MAKLSLRGAKGTDKSGKSKAKAARKSSGGRRARKTLGGESGARKGSSGADTSFDFGGSSF
jgi:hypothetical protein